MILIVYRLDAACGICINVVVVFLIQHVSLHSQRLSLREYHKNTLFDSLLCKTTVPSTNLYSIPSVEYKFSKRNTSDARNERREIKILSRSNKSSDRSK